MPKTLSQHQGKQHHVSCITQSDSAISICHGGVQVCRAPDPSTQVSRLKIQRDRSKRNFLICVKKTFGPKNVFIPNGLIFLEHVTRVRTASEFPLFANQISQKLAISLKRLVVKTISNPYFIDFGVIIV